MKSRGRSGRARMFLRPEGSGLLQFFHRHFVPVVLDGREGAFAGQYRTAIRWLCKATGRDATLADLSAATIDLTTQAALDAGAGQAHCGTLAKRLRSLWWFAFRIGAVPNFERAKRRWRKRRQQGTHANAGGSICHDEAAPQEGTVWDFYRTTYAPQRLIGATAEARADYERTFRFMREHFGRDLPLSELSDATTADFLGSLTKRKRNPTTVNHHRARVLAVWRTAFDLGKISALPRIKKLKANWDEPDAWDENEAARIVEAAGNLDLMPICGIPANKWWRAFLLVAYWTGLRRGSLLKLRRTDVNLDSGWLHVRPTGIKTRRGKRFRLGPDAIAALREIWLPEREHVFPWYGCPNSTRLYFRRILQSAGIQPSQRRSMNQTHKWRRTVATIAAQRGGLAAAVALMGHSGEEMTRRYIDPTKLPGNDATQLLPALPSCADASPRSKAS